MFKTSKKRQANIRFIDFRIPDIVKLYWYNITNRQYAAFRGKDQSSVLSKIKKPYINNAFPLKGYTKIKLLINILQSIRYLFRKRLKIPASFIHTQIMDFSYQADAEEIKQHQEAISNDNHGSHKSPHLSHPLFYTKINWEITRHLNDFLEKPVDENILKTLVHQSENITIFQPLKDGLNLRVRTKFWSIEPHSKGTKLMIRFDYFSSNLLLATEYSTAIFFGVKCIGESISLGKKPKSSRIKAEPIGKISVKIDSKLPWYYAEKTGIDAPIHTNPEFARSIGLPGNILQGTCTLGKSVNAILQLQRIHSTSGISHIAAKFTDMILPPDIITARILKLENGMIYFDVLNGNGKAVIKGGQIILK